MIASKLDLESRISELETENSGLRSKLAAAEKVNESLRYQLVSLKSLSLNPAVVTGAKAALVGAKI